MDNAARMIADCIIKLEDMAEHGLDDPEEMAEWLLAISTVLNEVLEILYDDD